MAVSQQVAGGDPGDHLRDRDSGEIRAGRERPPGEARPAGTAREDVSALELLCIMYARLAEDRAGDGYRGGVGRGVGDDGVASVSGRLLRGTPGCSPSDMNLARIE